MQRQITNWVRLELKHIVIILLICFMTSPSVWAKGPSGLNAGKTEIEHYLRGKYKIKDVVIEDQKDHHGLSRTLHLGIARNNDLTPPALAAQGDHATKDPRAVAKAFFMEEANLFELTPDSEMKEKVRPTSLTNTEGYISLSYEHYLNGLRLEGAGAGVTFGPTGAIVRATALVVDITPALLQAVKSSNLPKTEIRRAIKKDLIASGLNPDKVTHLEDEKYATPMPPYVVWEVRMVGNGLEYALEYVVDAFTGQILKKKSSLQD